MLLNNDNLRPVSSIRIRRTPVLLGDEARTLLDSIDVSTIVSLRDRALIALLIYSFARISAALQMNVGDFTPKESAGGCGYMRKVASNTRCRRIVYWGFVKFRFWTPGRVASWAEIVGVFKRQSRPDFPLRLLYLTTPLDC
jgi:hypothetical protein